jgi:hypothetical protein
MVPLITDRAADEKLELDKEILADQENDEAANRGGL